MNRQRPKKPSTRQMMKRGSSDITGDDDYKSNSEI